MSAAEEFYRLAIETAQRQQSRAWELRAVTSLARLLQRTGRAAAVRSSLAAIYGGYTEGFGTPDLIAAEAVLRSLT